MKILPIQENPMIPTKTANILLKKHLLTSCDIAEFAPKKYIDYRTVVNVNETADGDAVVLKGNLLELKKKLLKDNSKEYLIGKMEQEDGTLITIMIFQNLYLLDTYLSLVGQEVIACGKISYSVIYGFSLSNPDILVSSVMFRPHIKTVYTKFSGISEKKMRELIFDAVKDSEELLETPVLTLDSVPDYRESLYKLHYPENFNDVLVGKKRLLYDELLYLAIEMQKDAETSKEKAPVFQSTSLSHSFASTLPFTLTADQQKTVEAMMARAQTGKCNNVLLQGDVGCGKTIVAACMMVCAAENGYQSVLMAPRGVLAKQHYEEISGYTKMMGFQCVFLHSGMKARERKEALSLISSGKALFIVGTHSCISEDVEYQNLGLVITDEEHLFGVSQKSAIKEKAKQGLHYISMSATPIPRTIADALYGDTKQILSIKEKPAGRKEILTQIAQDRDSLFQSIEREIRAGHQCYVVCPAIEDDEAGNLTSIETVEKIYKNYYEKKGIKLGIVNGKMKKADVDEVMSAFEAGDIQILLSTTVIEVGVNVPSATVMVVEQADRFGLASLHQLRGRVGRSELQSYCYLVSDVDDNDRLRVLCQTNDGFEIAEADLIQRGTGNLIGLEQSGFNKLVEEMLQYPKMYAHIKQTASFCIEHGYGKELVKRYTEPSK